MFCKNCGAEIVDGAAFCPNCGASFGAPANPYASAPANSYANAPANPYASAPAAYAPAARPGYPQKKSRKWLIPTIIGAVIAIIAVVVLVTHKTCDSCGKWYWFGGKSYYGMNICGDCASKTDSVINGLGDIGSLIGGLGSLFG